MRKILFLIFFISFSSFCQEKKIKIFNPKKASRLSAILPGLGQVYNKQYWKVPVIYGGYAVIGHYIKFNIDNPVTPLDLFQSPDARKLGILVESIEISDY